MIKNTQQATILETVKTSWSKVQGSKATLWAAFGCFLLIMFGLELIYILVDSGIALEIGIELFVKIAFTILQAGLIYIGIQRAFDLPISYRMLFLPLQDSMPFKIIGMYCLQVLIMMLGSLLIYFIVKPIAVVYHTSVPHWSLDVALLLVLYLSIRMLFAIGFLLERKVNPWRAIVLSFKITRANFFKVLAFLLIAIAALLISLIPLGLGLIWSLPFLIIFYGVVYKNLSQGIPN